MSRWLIFRNEPSVPFSPAGEGQRGMALIMAVVSVFLMTVAVMHTRAGVNLAEEIATGSAQEMQAFYMARSGLAIVHDALADDDPAVDSFQDDWAAANDLGAVPIADIGWAVGKVSDEEGKFNVLDLVNEDGESDEDTDFAAGRLFDILVGIQISDTRADEIVDSLIDWMDFDEAVTGSGAEDLHYASLDDPYTCPNDVPAGVDELALVKGIGPELLYKGEGDAPALVDYLTVHGDRKPGDRFRRVNINTAPLEVILSLSPEMDLDLAEEILFSREEEPFRTAAELKDVPGFPDEIYNSEIENGIKLADLVDVSSDHFSTRITGETTEASSRVFGVFERKGSTVNLVYYRGF